MLSMFEIVVPANNLMYLKNFHTFLSIYFLLDADASPIERKLGKLALAWIENKSLKIYKELRRACQQKTPYVTLESVDVDLFTALFVANQDKMEFTSANDLFVVLSNMRLEFQKLKSPRKETTYQKDV